MAEGRAQLKITSSRTLLIMARGSHACCFALLLVFLALAFADVGDARRYKKLELNVGDARRSKNIELKYYVQLEGGAPDIATNFLPPLNTTFSANFGAGMLFAFNITKDISPTSQLLGFVRGFTVDTNFVAGAPSLSLEVATIQYDDGECAGTLQVQGLVQASNTEVAITGGTGSFRGANGYLLISQVAFTPPSIITFLHELYLL